MDRISLDKRRFFLRKSYKRRSIVILFVLLLFSWGIFLVSPFGGTQRAIYPREFTLLPGEGILQTAQQLSDAKLIKNRVSFILYVVATGKRTQLRAGQYVFEEPMALSDLIATLTDSKTSVKEEIEITLIEGWTLVQMSEYLGQTFHGVYSGDFSKEFATLASSNQFQDTYDFLKEKPMTVSLEGYLFPDTYRLFQDATPLDVIERLLENFDSKLDKDMRAAIAREGRTIHEVTTLASILEREVRTLQDKRIVADIFYRRLEALMPLQADSTVNYVTGKNDPSVSSVDLAIDSPYNTYRYIGLPPGPISNPGMDSLTAAVYRAQNEYWYFLTALDDGEVIYSKTFAEHLENQARYLGH